MHRNSDQEDWKESSSTTHHYGYPHHHAQHQSDSTTYNYNPFDASTYSSPSRGGAQRTYGNSPRTSHHHHDQPTAEAGNYNPFDGSYYESNKHAMTSPQRAYEGHTYDQRHYGNDKFPKDTNDDLEAGGGGAAGGAAVAEGEQRSGPVIADGAIRLAFIRKVYAILACQLLVTIGVACLFMFNDSVNSFVTTRPQLFYVALILSFVSLISLFCYRNKYPVNLLLLGVFTLVESYTIGLITAIYNRNGAGGLVLQAFIITTAIFIGLSIFTYVSKIDFSFLGGILFGLLIALFAWGIIIWIMGWRMSFIYSLLGSILFSLFLVYDTHALANRLSPDDYIIGAISLYLDLINLFIFILSMLGRGGGRE